MMNPETRRTLIRSAAALVFLILTVWLMILLNSITTMLMVAFFLAYILDPLVDRLEARKIPRFAASLGILLLVVLGFILVIVIVLPTLVHELARFASLAPKYLTVLKDYALKLVDQLNVGLPENWAEMEPILLEKGRALLPKLGSLLDPVSRFASQVLGKAMGAFIILMYMVLTPILAYYLLVSFDDIRQGIVDLIPPYTREPILDKLGEINRALAGFIRGQVIICLILAALYSLGFLIIGIDLAVVLGVLGGLLFIIPYFGTMIAVVGGSLMALAKFGDAAHVVYVLAWIGAVQLLESYVFTPKIVGDAVGLHPVFYILALMVGGQLFGLVGMLVAIPVAAILKVLLTSAVEAYQNSELYQDTAH
ncbi:AI-2E family transporter [Thermodesulfobacteriota bacterium]